ncbi:MAG: eukaryotic translation initiation factor 2c [Lasallia pustulata]|uniref:Eukaryotic translation initiation factor 2c n=1 Tax=Lasallia pustulata TaxID=136370 RepID=A0A5M8PIE4_9LECA|nr:MAG: eukaryotic translation initiation factor 2c [Lasallia pustulata]
MPGAAKKRAKQDRQALASSGSNEGSTQASQTLVDPSTAGSYDGPSDVTRPVLRDPAREPVLVTSLNRNIDLPGTAYNLDRQYEVPAQLIRRPAQLNSSGKGIVVGINSYPITQFPTQTVYQYDVHIGTGVEKRGLISAVWASNAVKTVIGHGWIFDGNKIAWSLKDAKQELRVEVDLDVEKGMPARAEHPNHHKVVIRKTNAVNLGALSAYLYGKMSFDNSVLEAINFLDHLLREVPSKRLISIKRSFFARGMSQDQRVLLGGGVEAMKGVYQSIRAAHGAHLVVNADVSNTTFWSEAPLHILATQVTGASNPNDLVHKCKKVTKGFGQQPVESPAFKDLRKLKKIKVWAIHRAGEREKVYTIKQFSEMTARSYKFKCFIKASNKEEVITIEEYFQRRYNRTLDFPGLPLVETMKKGVLLPMEVLVVAPAQRYPYKLNETQTSNMIRFAVTKPSERLTAIEKGLKMLDWENDPAFKHYGLKIQGSMLKTNARLLTNPQVEFGSQNTVNPGVSGRWDLKGRRFLIPGASTDRPLRSWGVCRMNNGRDTVDLATAQKFIQALIAAYQAHGGFVENKKPVIIEGGDDAGKAVESIFNAAGNQAQLRPQMLVFMLPDKGAFQYLRIKKSSDCRYGIVSQCVQNLHVQKCAPQYLSNVLMKFNAKLGGTTAKVASKSPLGQFTKPTLVIGADVSHAAPGSLQPSMAAITVSMDKIAARYAAACETNGHRVEMITTNNIETMVKPLLHEWCSTVNLGRLPEHLLYFRDGVSEGQYQHVLQQEVKDLKRIFEGVNPNTVVKFAVIVASKRHHIRFFPGPAGDRSHNPLPGTLVEKDVTHPFEYDFYLNSHAAIQGTARPTHYHVLMDEIGMSANELQNMIYEHSYQYMRSTTPVSLFPAVYYAHLASNRARAHENIPASAGPHTSEEAMNKKSTTSSDKPPTEEKPLIPMMNLTRIQTSMWYI